MGKVRAVQDWWPEFDPQKQRRGGRQNNFHKTVFWFPQMYLHIHSHYTHIHTGFNKKLKLFPQNLKYPCGLLIKVSKSKRLWYSCENWNGGPSSTPKRLRWPTIASATIKALEEWNVDADLVPIQTITNCPLCGERLLYWVMRSGYWVPWIVKTLGQQWEDSWQGSLGESEAGDK